MARRLKTCTERGKVFEDAIEWLTDGIALLRADGSIVHANAAMCAFAQSGNGVRFAGQILEFTEIAARDSFNAALGAVARLGDPSFDTRPTDFPVPRGSGMPALIASVRPVVGAKGCISSQEGVVLLLLRDPLWRNAATTLMLQELFSLTNAEAHLAQALCKWCNNESLCDRTVREPQHRLFASQTDSRENRLQEHARAGPQIR
ncbi:MAG TPA: hypothetical protein VI137_08045 [Pseudolabrys sp.]|jgi:hypothetical protein